MSRTANSGRRSTRLGGLAVLVALVAALLSTGSSQAAGVTITIKNFQFTPTPAKIGVGGTVTWINKDIGDHKIIFNDGVYPSSQLLAPGEKYSVKMKRAGTVNYYDGVAGFMTGTIFVSAAAAPTAAPKATSKPKATPRPTAKPTAKPAATAKATAKPAASATAVAVAESVGPSQPPEAGGTTGDGSSPPPDSTISSTGSSNDGGISLGVWLLLIGGVGIAFVGGIWFSSSRRRPPSPPLVREAALAPPVRPSTNPSITTVEPRPRAAVPPSAPAPQAQVPGDVDEDAPLDSRRRGFQAPENDPPQGL
jgi:plastocyanin